MEIHCRNATIPITRAASQPKLYLKGVAGQLIKITFNSYFCLSIIVKIIKKNNFCVTLVFFDHALVLSCVLNPVHLDAHEQLLLQAVACFGQLAAVT